MKLILNFFVNGSYLRRTLSANNCLTVEVSSKTTKNMHSGDEHRPETFFFQMTIRERGLAHVAKEDYKRVTVRDVRLKKTALLSTVRMGV